MKTCRMACIPDQGQDDEDETVQMNKARSNERGNCSPCVLLQALSVRHKLVLGGRGMGLVFLIGLAVSIAVASLVQLSERMPAAGTQNLAVFADDAKQFRQQVAVECNGISQVLQNDMMRTVSWSSCAAL